MSDTKMSGERAREILEQASSGKLPMYKDCLRDLEEAQRLGAAAIAERDELVEALEAWMHEYMAPASDSWTTGTIGYGPLLKRYSDLLVRHGRVIRDGETYKWSDRR